MAVAGAASAIEGAARARRRASRVGANVAATAIGVDLAAAARVLAAHRRGGAAVRVAATRAGKAQTTTADLATAAGVRAVARLACRSHAQLDASDGGGAATAANTFDASVVGAEARGAIAAVAAFATQRGGA